METKEQRKGVPDLQMVVQAYLEAFEARDLSRCLDFYAEDATINFLSGLYEGQQAIEEWHQDRFTADLRLVQVDEISVQGDTATVDAVATSKRLRIWKIDSLNGRATFRFENGKIKQAKFGLQMNNPELWRL